MKLSVIAGIIMLCIVSAPAVTSAGCVDAGGDQPVLSYRTDSLTASDIWADIGHILTIEIDMRNDASDVGSCGFALDFDTRMLVWIETFPGDLEPPTGWDLFQCAEVTPGRIEVTCSSQNESIPAGSLGALAVVRVRVICTDCQDQETSALTFPYLLGDLSGFAGIDGEFRYDT